jgi:hypothetical protein
MSGPPTKTGTERRVAPTYVRSKVRRTRQYASRWRQRVTFEKRPHAASRAQAQRRLPKHDTEDAFDEGFTVGDLSIDRAAFAALVPPERRLIIRAPGSETRVAFDVIDIYRWLRINPDGGICGPFGQLAIGPEQRSEIIARAEALLPARQRVPQEARFDYAWHDDGADLHYHDQPSAAYLRERVAVGDHEGVLYCLGALGPGDIGSQQEARALLVEAANSALTSIFERLVAHEHIRNALGVAGLVSLIDDIAAMRTPRIDLLVPSCRTLARWASARGRPSSLPSDSRSTSDIDSRGEASGVAAEMMTRMARRIYRHMCARALDDQGDTDDDDSDDSDDDSSSKDDDDDSDSDSSTNDQDRDALSPADAGSIPPPLVSAVVRALFEATLVEPDTACLIAAMDVGARDVLDYMLGVAASLALRDTVALARHAISIGCAHSLRLIMHHCGRMLTESDMDAVARAAANVPLPTSDILSVIVAVWRRPQPAGEFARPSLVHPRRMRFEG